MATPYDQYCPIARGLDLVGDRWTLLVLRDLAAGPQRFTDLRRSLPGIPPAVLSERLQRLVADGMVQQRELPPPAARQVYALTRRGLDVLPVLRALVRFGMPALEPADPEVGPPARTVVPIAFLSWFDDAEARLLDVDEHYDVVVEGTVTHLSSRAGVARREVAGPAAATVEGSAWALTRLRQGRGLDDAVAAGEVALGGSKAAQRRFRRLYALG
jgi:DNA-binding HxlR family transcriptional regulator